jgi:capsular polysaccharide biosynthesis protein
MRETLDIPESPQNEIFISRKGYRRGIEREDDLFAALLPSFPNLRSILPDDFSVAEQAVLFSNAKLIISPHGASLTNVVFSNWDKVVLIEFSPERSEFFATFRNDLQVKRHYLMKCQSVPCKTKNKQKNCDVWEQQIDVDVAHSTEVIKSIMSDAHADREDFVIRRHGHSGAASY